MSEDHLRELLRELHAEFERSDTDDERTRELLREVRDDIAARLDRPHAGQLRERLEGAAALFEATHPQLAGLITRTLDSLAKLGI